MQEDQSALPMLDPKTMKPALNPILVVDGKGLDQVKHYLDTHNEFSWDLETNVTPSYYQRKIRTFMLGDADQQFIIDMLAFADGDSNKLWAGQGEYRKPGSQLRKWWRDIPEYGKVHLEYAGKQLDDPKKYSATPHINPNDESFKEDFDLVDVNPNTFKAVVDLVRPSLESDAWLKIGYALEFEYIQTKWNLGIRSWNYYDLFMGERLRYNGKIDPLISDFWALDDMIARTFKARISKEYQTKFNLTDPLTEEHIQYGAMDIRLPWKLRQVQEPLIKQIQVSWAFQIENDAIPAFGDMHINGLWVDPERWLKIYDDNVEALNKAADKLDEYAIPLVGRKVLPNPEKVLAAQLAYKSFDEKPEEEKEVAKQIRGAKKDPELFAELTARRSAMEAERKRKRDEAKVYYESIRYLATKGYADEVETMAGQAAINYNSHIQVKAMLFKAYPDFNDKTLKNLDAKKTLIKYMDRPIVAAFVGVKKLEKQLSSYGHRWITTRNKVAINTSNAKGFVDPDTGRIHPPFRQFGTETGRPSCNNPNILNLPKDNRYREAFVARPGYKNCTKDCAGQELRILTEISREPAWVEAFNNDKDVHSISAALIQPTQWKAAAVHEPYTTIIKGKEVTIPKCAFYYDNFKKCECPKHGKIRGNFKAVNFGIAYDKQAPSLAAELGISVEDAQMILDEWKATFRITQAALENLREESYANGEARTLSGRRRLLTRVNDKKVTTKLDEKYGEGKWTQWQKQKMTESLVAAVKREGGNMPIQGCVVGSSLILEETRGLVAIEDVCGRPVRVWDGDRFVNAHVVFSGRKRKVDVEFGGRRSISVSEDHKFLHCGTRGNFDWRVASAFNKQSWVKHNSNVPAWSAKVVKYPEVYVALASNGKGANIQSLDHNRQLLGEFIGRIASDGSVNPNKSVRLIVAEHEKAIIPRLKEAMEAVAPGRWDERTKIKKLQTLKGEAYKPVHEFTLEDSGFANQLWLAGVKQKVPDFIRQDSTMLSGYLRGMFDGDGTVLKDGAELKFGQTGKKEAWAFEIQQCLAALGIRGNVARNAGSRVVRVVKYDSDKFYQRVGFMNPIKTTKLSKLVEGSHSTREQYVRGIQARVVTITDSEVEMYDVVNSETERFMVNGLITHNSGADMMKLAIGCGFDPDGEPYLWHIAEPLYDAMLENYVYDELMYETPDTHCDAVGGPKGVGGCISDAIMRAGGMFVTVVKMASEGAVAQTWTK